MDQISTLPKPILHDILSRLPEKDAARTSILSKAWKDTWFTFPNLVFNEYSLGIYKFLGDPDPQEVEDLRRKRNNLHNSVDSTLLRFHEQGLAVKEFKFIGTSFDSQSMSPRIDHWMKLVCEGIVKVLELKLAKTERHIISLDEPYYLPPCVLEAKSLTELVLSGAIRVDQAFLNHPIKFSSLQVLSLSSVHVGDERTIQNLFSSCPLIEFLTLEFIHGDLKYVKIHGLPKLKTVKALRIEEVEVNAPHLENLHVGTDDPDLPCRIEINNCRNLRGLNLDAVSSINITNQWFLELFCNFPLLEELVLDCCTLSERIKISSVRLKVLKLGACVNLKELEIDAPNLYSCQFRGDVLKTPAISFLHCSNQLKFIVLLTTCTRLDFGKLREFLPNMKPGNLLASLVLIIFDSTVEFNPDSLQHILVPLPSIKKLELRVHFESEASCLALIDGLFWSCRPAIVSLQLLPRWASELFIKVFWEKVMGRKEEECCCSSSQIICLWHSLKDVKFTTSFGRDENMDSLDNVVDALRSQKQHVFSPVELIFNLDWLY